MISIFGGWLDVVIFNVIFWAGYTWLCSLPYRAFQAAIDRHGINTQ